MTKQETVLISTGTLGDYETNASTLEEFYQKEETLKNKIHELNQVCKKPDVTDEQKQKAWDEADAIRLDLNFARRVIKSEKVKLIEIVNGEEILEKRISTISYRDDSLLKEKPLLDGYSIRNIALSCTRCGHEKFQHGWDDGSSQECTSCTRGSSCPVYSQNQKYPYSKKNCKHVDIAIYGDIKKPNVYCINNRCFKKLPIDDRAKKLIDKYTRVIPTETEWKETLRFHTDGFGSESDSYVLEVIINKDSDGYDLKTISKRCPRCYSKEHDERGHYEQKYSDMKKNIEITLKEFNQK